MRWHWQNLNEDKRGFWGRSHRFPWHGRAWLGRLGACWDLWGSFCGIGVEFDGGDREVTFFVALPPVSLWFTVGRVRFWKSLGYGSREIRIGVHDWAVWWTVWRDEMAGWDRSVPRWRQGSWHVLDTLLGSTRYSNVDLETHEIAIPMPEGSYRARATFERSTWKRPRWFARVRDFTKVDVLAPGGIPHEGKGENSWDCGADGLCGYSVEGHSLTKAIARGVESSLRSRQRYDGNVNAKYPAPEPRRVR
jgi:hypothetical protein